MIAKGGTHQLPSEGQLADWFEVPHLMRSIGAVFQGERRMSHPIEVSDHFDGIIFVDPTTRARPVE